MGRPPPARPGRRRALAGAAGVDDVATKRADGFDWVDPAAGKGEHHILVKRRLATSSTADADADATVGNPTLIVEPVAARDETRDN